MQGGTPITSEWVRKEGAAIDLHVHAVADCVEYIVRKAPFTITARTRLYDRPTFLQQIFLVERCLFSYSTVCWNVQCVRPVLPPSQLYPLSSEDE